MWSLGCILFELIYCSQDYTKHLSPSMLRDKVESRILFPGTSCYPLSPCSAARKSKDKSQNIVSSSDQLIVINKTLGRLSEQDVDFLQTKTASQYQA